MKKITFPLVLLFAFVALTTVAQTRAPKCGTERAHLRNLQKKPGLAADIARKNVLMQQWLNNHSAGKIDDSLPAVINIPVVVHIVYHAAAENISDTQVLSQITRLNLDYRKQNSDTLDALHPYHPTIADAGFEFCLAKRDPNGHPTTGITRTHTDSIGFDPNGNDLMKFTSSGGIDAWDPHKYLNIWVVKFSPDDGTLGYTSYPSDLDSFPDYDGTVIGYQYFGTGPTTQSPIDLGRTATHELGHWVYLVHIWGDSHCGDDSIADTPTQADANMGCPAFPSVSCSNGPNGDMFMNYMDYTDDSCMNMFTHGQVARMRAAFVTFRSSILLSNGCLAVDTTHTGINTLSTLSLQVIPNPSNGNMVVKLAGYSGKANMALYDMVGREVWTNSTETSGTDVAIQVNGAAAGMYVLKVMAGSELLTRKIIIR